MITHIMYRGAPPIKKDVTERGKIRSTEVRVTRERQREEDSRLEETTTMQETKVCRDVSTVLLPLLTAKTHPLKITECKVPSKIKGETS